MQRSGQSQADEASNIGWHGRIQKKQAGRDGSQPFEASGLPPQPATCPDGHAANTGGRCERRQHDRLRRRHE
jgi:hypothetical protein